MSGTEIVRRDTDSWVDVLPAVGELAGRISATDFVPESLRGRQAAVAAAILYGREVGLAPMQALQSVSVIKGKPTLSAEAKRALVLAAGHSIRFVEMTATRCIVEGRRRGEEEPTRVSYTMDDAKRAGLAGQRQYQTMPRQMLAARATTELCRLVFPDVVGGLLSAEELVDDVAPVEAPAEPARRRVVRRASPAPQPVPPPAPVVEPPLDVDTATGEIVEAELVDDEPPLDDEPQMVTSGQLKAMGAAFTAIGWTDRGDRLRATSAIVGRAVESAKSLTRDEASVLLDTLAFVRDSEDPSEALTGIVESASGVER